MQLYIEIGKRLSHMETCNEEWKLKRADEIEFFAKEFLPSGSGFDAGTHVNLEKSNGKRIVIETSYHHMVEGGYVGWSDHAFDVVPRFGGFDISLRYSNFEDVAKWGIDGGDCEDFIVEEISNSLQNIV